MFDVIPSATTTIAKIGEVSSPWFSEFLPIVYISLGCLVGGVLIAFIVRTVTHSLTGLMVTKNDIKKHPEWLQDNWKD